MNFRPLAVLAALVFLPVSAAFAQSTTLPLKMRYRFVPGQRLRYLVQYDPYFADPAGAMETTNPNVPYKPPVVERVTEEVLAVGTDGVATLRVTIAPEPGFEDAANPQPPRVQTVQVTPLGQVLSPMADPDQQEFLRTFFRLPAAPVSVGASWKGTALQGTDKVRTSAALTAVRSSQGLAILTQTWPPVVSQGRSPDHDGTLLQTTQSAQSDRAIFDTSAGNLRRQVSTLTVTLSLVMTERGTRGAADFGRVIPNVQVTQTLTVERQDDPPFPASVPAATARPGRALSPHSDPR